MNNAIADVSFLIMLMGDWAVSSEIFTAMVLVSAMTCILSPIVIRKFLNKWLQNGGN